jgi:hypothetical protein
MSKSDITAVVLAAMLLGMGIAFSLFVEQCPQIPEFTEGGAQDE